MAATPESAVKKKIKAMLKEHGVYFAMPVGSGYGHAGVPDFLCCIRGLFFSVEAKAGKGTTTALQDAEMDRIRAAGGIALVINENNINDLKEFLNARSTDRA
jgi:hypothetical protein